MGVVWRNRRIAVSRVRGWSVGLLLLAPILLIYSQVS
jgi:hypothetical protein